MAGPCLPFHLRAGRSKESEEDWAGPRSGQGTCYVKEANWVSLNLLSTVSQSHPAEGGEGRRHW